jgi:hypothetical protein
MSQTIEAPLPYASGEQQHLGLLVRTADQQPTAAVALLPDWRGQSGLARDHALYLTPCVTGVVASINPIMGAR